MQNSEKGKIRFNGAVHEVEAFTFDQLQEIVPKLDQYYRVGIYEGLSVGREIIAAALDQSAEDLGPARTSVDEIWDAVESIARISGLQQLGERLKAERSTPPEAGTGSGSTPT